MSPARARCCLSLTRRSNSAEAWPRAPAAHARAADLLPMSSGKSRPTPIPQAPWMRTVTSMRRGTKPPATGWPLSGATTNQSTSDGEQAEPEPEQPHRRPRQPRQGEAEGEAVQPAPEAEVGDPRHPEGRHGVGRVRRGRHQPGRVQERPHALVEGQHGQRRRRRSRAARASVRSWGNLSHPGSLQQRRRRGAKNDAGGANACPCAEDMGTTRRDAKWSWWSWTGLGASPAESASAAPAGWRLRRPDHDGAMVAVWLDGRVLAVQQSYRTKSSWPGGDIRRGDAGGGAA